MAFYSFKKNKKWIIKALDRATGRTVAWVIGGRDAATFRRLYDKVKHLTQCVFYTDDWETFAKVLPPAASPSLDAEILVLLQNFSAASFLSLAASSESLISPQCKQLIYRFLKKTKYQIFKIPS